MDADKFALVNRNALCQSADINLICCYNVSDKAGLGIESYRSAVCACQHAVLGKRCNAVGNVTVCRIGYCFAVVTEETPCYIRL